MMTDKPITVVPVHATAITQADADLLAAAQRMAARVDAPDYLKDAVAAKEAEA
jgi:hypothetical protein